MKRAFRQIMALGLASVTALSLSAAIANAQPYGYRHHHFGTYGPGFSYEGPNRAQQERGTGQ
jgi:hypothetical protein